MSTKNMAPNAELIYNTVCTVGAITKSQTARILEGTKYPTVAENLLRSLHHMKNVKFMGPDYVVSFFDKKVDTDAVQCLWVALDLLTGDDGFVNLEGVRNIIDGNNIAKFSFIQSDKAVVTVFYVGKTEFSKIAASKQRFYDVTGVEAGNEKSAGLIYLYVTDSLEVIDMIKNANIKFPHITALVKGDPAQKPEIRYFKD